MARADSLSTSIHLESSLKISGAIPTLNLSASMAHSGTTYLTLPPTYLSRDHMLSCLIKEPFYTLFTSYMHTTSPIYFIFIVPVTLMI